MYDVSKLNSPAECRTVMERARKQGLTHVYNAVFRRFCELAGKENEDPTDPLVRDFFETLAAYEQLLTEKNGSTTIASRTRQKIANKGVHMSLMEWTQRRNETNGFTLFVEAGLPELTGEYLVIKYCSRFPAEVVAAASKRLTKHGIQLPSNGSIVNSDGNYLRPTVFRAKMQ
jgi:hypothetical protein